MTPFYADDLITLYHCDCMDYIAECADKQFDLAICDVPYGIGGSRPTGTYAREAIGYTKDNDKKWDKKIPDAEYFKALFRITENQIIWGANYIVKHLPPSSGWICWYKTDELKGRDFGEFELAFTSFNIRPRHFEYRPFIKNGERIHPTQKIVPLYHWLLQNYAKPNDTIFDSHGGSLSIAIACHDLGYKLTACELDLDYLTAAVNRIKNYLKQPKLFKPPVPVETQQRIW